MSHILNARKCRVGLRKKAHDMFSPLDRLSRAFLKMRRTLRGSPSVALKNGAILDRVLIKHDQVDMTTCEADTLAARPLLTRQRQPLLIDATKMISLYVYSGAPLVLSQVAVHKPILVTVTPAEQARHVSTKANIHSEDDITELTSKGDGYSDWSGSTQASARDSERSNVLTRTKPDRPAAQDSQIPRWLANITSSHWQSQYQVVKGLQWGGEGSCVVVRCRRKAAVYAMKVVWDPEITDRKPHEAVMLDALRGITGEQPSHPSIIHMEAWGLHSQPPLVFAEYYLPYLPLGDLHAFIDRFECHSAFIPELFIWKTYLQIASALTFLHAGFYYRDSVRISAPGAVSTSRPGIVHRDVKPENILLRLPSDGDTYPDLVLCDFGHATFTEFTYTPSGTPEFRAPELPRASPKSDVWSLGAVIHCMIHFDLVIAPLPSFLPSTDRTREWWYSRAEARQPILRMPVGSAYSAQLGEALSYALRKEARRPYAATLQGWVEVLAQEWVDSMSEEEQDDTLRSSWDDELPYWALPDCDDLD